MLDSRSEDVQCPTFSPAGTASTTCPSAVRYTSGSSSCRTPHPPLENIGTHRNLSTRTKSNSTICPSKLPKAWPASRLRHNRDRRNHQKDHVQHRRLTELPGSSTRSCDVGSLLWWSYLLRRYGETELRRYHPNNRTAGGSQDVVGRPGGSGLDKSSAPNLRQNYQVNSGRASQWMHKALTSLVSF